MVPIKFNDEHLQNFHLEELVECRYYYGSLSEKEAVDILGPEKYGTYLIWDGPVKTNVPLKPILV